MEGKAKCVVCGKDISEKYQEDGVCEVCYNSAIRCPVCGKYTFEEWGDYDVCEVCYWENDPLQYERPDYKGGANTMSLNEARKIYQQTGKPLY